MELNEVTELIEIRNYMSNAINNYALDRAKVSQLNEMLVLIDRRIVDKILSTEFKNQLGYEADAKRFLNEARAISNIKSGLKV